MAPAMNTRSQSNANKDSSATTKTVADKRKNEDEKTKIAATETNNSKANIEDWLAKVNHDVDSKDDGGTTKKRGTTKQSAATAAKRQKRLSSYVRVSKSTTNDGKGKEQTQEVETNSTLKETNVSPDRKVTRERHEIITDTTIITTKDVYVGKRKRVEDDDADYMPPGSGAAASGLAEAAEEDVDEWTTKRPRRKVRSSTSSYSCHLSSESSYDGEAGSPHLSGKKETVLTLRIAGLRELDLGVGSYENVANPMSAGDPVTATPFPSTRPIVKTKKLPVAKRGRVRNPNPNPVRKRATLPTPEGGWDNKLPNFKFGWTPYSDHEAPTHEEAAEVFEILRVDLAPRGITVGPGEKGPNAQIPAHGSTTAVTVDAMVRTFLSQATSNENALFVQDRLIEKYTYTVDGKEVRGSIPNYHKVHAGSEADLEPVIKPSGLGPKRARYIKDYLATVYKANTIDNPDWDGVYTGNAPNAPDFVPGLLSLGFLDGLSKVELFKRLMDVKGVGIKTAHCLMDFSYRMPICAVDTHVHFMAGALGWIPKECIRADDAAMHLDARLPDALKHDLHQAFWNHRQHCGPCKKADGNKVTGADAARCVLEDRLARRDTREYRRGPKKVVVEMSKVVKTARKSSMRQLSTLKPEKAAELGYVYHELLKTDDFGAGSVNKTVKTMWKLVSE